MTLAHTTSTVVMAFACGVGGLAAAQSAAPGVRVERLLDAPIIRPDLHPSIGENIQGPSLIRVPDWVEDRLGAYYLYFADHKGRYIRLAYADDLLGPWHVHQAGSLQIANSHFLTEPPAVSPEELERLRAARAGRSAAISHDLLTEVTTPHIASPDVHVDDENRRIVMYFHGLDGVSRQVSRVAASRDGIHFDAGPEVLGRTYMRVFRHDGYTYAMSMPGQFYRSRNPLGRFEAGPASLQPEHAPRGALAPRRHPARVLDAGGADPGAHQAEHDRHLGRLDDLVRNGRR